jgi:transposase
LSSSCDSDRPSAVAVGVTPSSGRSVSAKIAQAALSSPELRRLMSVPGVNVIVAASFLAAIGDIGRFERPRKRVGYLGLDPRVRQSVPGPATHGHISKQGSVRARHAHGPRLRLLHPRFRDHGP